MAGDEQRGDRHRQDAHGKILLAPGLDGPGEVAGREREGTGDGRERHITRQQEDREEANRRVAAGERIEGQQGAQAGGHALAALETQVDRESYVPESTPGQ